MSTTFDSIDGSPDRLVGTAGDCAMLAAQPMQNDLNVNASREKQRVADNSSGEFVDAVNRVVDDACKHKARKFAPGSMSFHLEPQQ